jgi:choline dehydrogenase-like flavoprotein
MADTKVDVLVSGAGPAGSIVALRLARGGAKVLLLAGTRRAQGAHKRAESTGYSLALSGAVRHEFPYPVRKTWPDVTSLGIARHGFLSTRNA